MNERMSKHIGVTHLLGKKSIFSKNRTEPRHDSMWNFCAAAQIEPELQRKSMQRHDFGPLYWAAAWSCKKLPPHHFSLENECLKGKKEKGQRGSDFLETCKLVGVLGFGILKRLKQRLELWKRFGAPTIWFSSSSSSFPFSCHLWLYFHFVFVLSYWLWVAKLIYLGLFWTLVWSNSLKLLSFCD